MSSGYFGSLCQEIPDGLAVASEYVSSKDMALPSDPRTRQRAHAERMLARAERRSRQALKLVEKWMTRLADLDREGVAAKQAKLFADDQPEKGSEADTLAL
jgi:hypothetical protein